MRQADQLLSRLLVVECQWPWSHIKEKFVPDKRNCPINICFYSSRSAMSFIHKLYGRPIIEPYLFWFGILPHLGS